MTTTEILQTIIAAASVITTIFIIKIHTALKNIEEEPDE